MEILCLTHDEVISKVCFSPSGRCIATGALDGTVRIWDALSGRALSVTKCHDTNITKLEFSADARTILSAGHNEAICISNSSNGSTIRRIVASSVTAALSSDRQKVVSIGNGPLRVFDVRNGSLILSVENDREVVGAFSHDGSRIATGAGDPDFVVRIRDAVTGNVLLCLQGHEDHVLEVCWSKSDKQLLSCSWDGTIRVWDVECGSERYCLRGFGGDVYGVAFAPDGSRIAAALQDHTIRVWNADGGKMAAKLKGHESGVSSLAFSPNAQKLASVSIDETVRIWDVAPATECLCLPLESWGWCVAFSPDSQAVIAETIRGSTHVYHAETGELLRLDEIEKRRQQQLIGKRGLSMPPHKTYTQVETAFSFEGTAGATCWYPAHFACRAYSQCGRYIAGSVREHVLLLKMEGDVSPGSAMLI